MDEPYITFLPHEVASYYAARVPDLRQRGAEWRGPCPIHQGQDDNFAVKAQTGQWYCHSSCGRGGDIFDLEKAFYGGDFVTRKAAVFQLVGRVEPPFRQPNNRNSGRGALANPGKRDDEWRQVEEYQYKDAYGNLLHEVVRFERGEGAHRLKRFRQRRPDGRGGWHWDRYAVEPVPYRLPTVSKAETVFLPEGEKDVHTLESWGLTASWNPGGAQ